MAKIGEGVHDVYKERARKGGDVLWHVTIKGQNELTPGIPLHMSLKVFEDNKDMDVEEIKTAVKKHGIKTPDPKKLSYKTTIFTSERDGKKYYMLMVEGVDKACSEFYDSMKHCGTVYKKFMPHVTIDKGLYDKINEEGLKSEEVEFSPLSIEFGAGNTIYEFSKTEIDLWTVRETIFLNLDLQKHSKAVSLDDLRLYNYIQDNPELKETVMRKHEERIAHHFGDNKTLSEIAWQKGIKEAYMSKSESKTEDVLEKLAELEHEQWIEWSKAVGSEVSEDRKKRWEKYWVPYSQLSEEVKEQDRKYARKVLALIKGK